MRAWGEDRVARADRNGTSILDDYPAGSTPEEIVRGNRAGLAEAHMTVGQILSRYANEDAYAAFDATATTEPCPRCGGSGVTADDDYCTACANRGLIVTSTPEQP